MTIIYFIKSFKFFKQLVDGLNSEFYMLTIGNAITVENFSIQLGHNL
jgi:hypothetical protein